MWLYTKHGFYSAVKKRGDNFITVRSYNKQDLQNLIDRFELDVAMEYTPSNDYLFRIRLSRELWVEIMAELAFEVDYGNFKAEVAKTHDWERVVGYIEIHDKTYQATASCTRVIKGR